MPKPVVLVCSVSRELEPLLSFMTKRERWVDASVPVWSGLLGDRDVVALAAGMGKTNAAHSLTRVCERLGAAAVVGFGIAGAYPGSDLAIGQVALAEVEVYGDEGVLTPTGWAGCEAIGIPLLESEDATLFNEFPSDPTLLRNTRNALDAQAVRAAIGRFVTVSTCSGTVVRGRELARRFDALCETMEGAAYAHVAALYGAPFVEIRGISNHVEDRDPARWRIDEGARSAAAAVAHAVVGWPDGTLSPTHSAGANH